MVVTTPSMAMQMHMLAQSVWSELKATSFEQRGERNNAILAEFKDVGGFTVRDTEHSVRSASSGLPIAAILVVYCRQVKLQSLQLCLSSDLGILARIGNRWMLRATSGA